MFLLNSYSLIFSSWKWADNQIEVEFIGRDVHCWKTLHFPNNSDSIFQNLKIIINETKPQSFYFVLRDCSLILRSRGNLIKCWNSSKYFGETKIFFKTSSLIWLQISQSLTQKDPSLIWDKLSRQMPLVNWHWTALINFPPGLYSTHGWLLIGPSCTADDAQC